MKIDVEESKIYSFRDSAHDLYICGMRHTGNKGYFSNLPDFADCEEGILCGVNVVANVSYENEVNYYPFKKVGKYPMPDVFRYFCPKVYAVEKEEPEFCPYKTLDELPFRVGDSVTFREKDSKEQRMLICSGITVNGPQLATIHLGAYIYYPETLFEGYEYFNGKEWVPFGAEE